MFKTASRILAVVSALAVSACASGGSFKTAYEPLDAKTTANWKVVGVNVTVPETLVATEDQAYIPRADIVWHGEPRGDRKAQVAQILKEGMTAGSKVVKGPQPVVLNASLVKFHATTKAARHNPYGLGAVDDLRYQLFVSDTKGNRLTEPQLIYGDFPAMTGEKADIEDARGNTERVQYVNHISAITSHWLGYGKDPRMTFESTGE